jgi:hypothetical protein
MCGGSVTDGSVEYWLCGMDTICLPRAGAVGCVSALLLNGGKALRGCRESGRAAVSERDNKRSSIVNV